MEENKQEFTVKDFMEFEARHRGLSEAFQRSVITALELPKPPATFWNELTRRLANAEGRICSLMEHKVRYGRRIDSLENSMRNVEADSRSRQGRLEVDDIRCIQRHGSRIEKLEVQVLGAS